MKNINKLAEIILNYEKDFDGLLIHGYEDDKEFLEDLRKTIKTEGLNKILEHYKYYLISRNDTNSTIEQRKQLKDIILILEGQID